MNGVWAYIGESVGEIREYVSHYVFGFTDPVGRVLARTYIGARPVYRYRWPVAP